MEERRKGKRETTFERDDRLLSAVRLEKATRKARLLGEKGVIEGVWGWTSALVCDGAGIGPRDRVKDLEVKLFGHKLSLLCGLLRGVLLAVLLVAGAALLLFLGAERARRGREETARNAAEQGRVVLQITRRQDRGGQGDVCGSQRAPLVGAEQARGRGGRRGGGGDPGPLESPAEPWRLRLAERPGHPAQGAQHGDNDRERKRRKEQKEKTITGCGL